VHNTQLFNSKQENRKKSLCLVKKGEERKKRENKVKTAKSSPAQALTIDCQFPTDPD